MAVNNVELWQGAKEGIACQCLLAVKKLPPLAMVFSALLLSLLASVHSIAAEDEGGGYAQDNWPELDRWQVNKDGRLEYRQFENTRELPEFEKHWLERGRDYSIDGWKYLTDQVDSYLAQDDLEIINDSYIRLRLGQTFLDDGQKFTGDIKLKADLARTENKIGLWAHNSVQLIVETDPDDLKTLEEKSLDRATQTDARQPEKSAVAGIRIGAAYKQWKSDWDIGVKSGFPVDPFTRLSFRRHYNNVLSSDWEIRWRHRFFAYRHRESGYLNSFNFGVVIDKTWSYDNATEIKWSHDEQRLTYSNSSSFTQRISSRSKTVWSVGGFYEDHPHNHVTNYYLQIRYTRRLYKDWFFIELTPRLDFPREFDYDSTPSFLMRFEILFHS